MSLKKRIRLFILLPAVSLSLATLVAVANQAGSERRVRLSDSKSSVSQTPTRPRTVTSAQVPSLGPGASLRGKQLFPADNPWNQDISNAPVDPNSANLIASIGNNDQLHPDFGTVAAAPVHHSTVGFQRIARRNAQTSGPASTGS